MATFDDIFTKSNLDESKKKAKMLFGRILIGLRKSNHIKLYSLLESVKETDIQDNVLSVMLSDKSAYDMINNQNDLNLLKEALKNIDASLDVSVCCDGKELFDMFKFESKLKQEFGKLLTIKK